MQTTKLKPVFAAGRVAAGTGSAGGIDAVQDKHVLGEIDAEKDIGHGHFLASIGSGLRLRNPTADPAQRQRMRINLGWLAGWLGDIPFIR